MGAPDAKTGFEKQTERARLQFEAALTRLGLGKEQIDGQSLPELEQSLDRVNDALQHPESFGVMRLKVTQDLGIIIVQAAAESHFEIGILPILLERKKQILDRIRELKGEHQIEDLKDTVKNVNDKDVRIALEEHLEAIRRENARFSQQSREVEQARSREQTNAQETLRRLDQEISERRARTWQSFFRRELIATLVGSLLLLILVGAQIVSMFARIQTTEIVNNAFLIILGYFFGQTISKASKDEDK